MIYELLGEISSCQKEIMDKNKTYLSFACIEMLTTREIILFV
jgi:hypothetical protein